MIGSKFPLHIGDCKNEGLLLLVMTCNGGKCDMAMNYNIYCVKSRSIVHRISQSEESACTLKVCDSPILQYVMKYIVL